MPGRPGRMLRGGRWGSGGDVCRKERQHKRREPIPAAVLHLLSTLITARPPKDKHPRGGSHLHQRALPLCASQTAIPLTPQRRNRHLFTKSRPLDLFVAKTICQYKRICDGSTSVLNISFFGHVIIFFLAVSKRIEKKKKPIFSGLDQKRNKLQKVDKQGERFLDQIWAAISVLIH